MIVTGIDPGESTGFAEYDDGKLVRLWTFKPLQAIAYLQMKEEGLFVMEDSRKQTTSFHDLKTNKRVVFTTGRRVGTVDRLCDLYQSSLGNNKLIMVSPLQKGSKMSHDDFVIKTGWDGKSNEHNRDAALVAYPFRWGAS